MKFTDPWYFESFVKAAPPTKGWVSLLAYVVVSQILDSSPSGIQNDLCLALWKNLDPKGRKEFLTHLYQKFPPLLMLLNMLQGPA